MAVRSFIEFLREKVMKEAIKKPWPPGPTDPDDGGNGDGGNGDGDSDGNGE